MKRNLMAILILALGTCPPGWAKEMNTSIQIIMDDSGVLQSPEEAQTHKMALLGHLKRLARRRNAAHAHMDVISMSYGRTVWTGTPLDLKRRPARAQDLVQKIESGENNCNNLPGAFAELKSNITALTRQGVKNVQIIVFSSLIHTPLPCSDASQITLPQIPPASGHINGALMSSPLIRSISFYWVSPHQKRVWEEFLTPAFDWALVRGIHMTFLDEERSKYALQKGLTGLEGRK